VPEDFRSRIVAVLFGIGPGEVVSYGEVAAEAGFPGAARGVGGVLARAEEDLPWWRVATATGRLAPGHEVDQAARLRAEGVAVVGGRVAGMTGPRGRVAGAGGRRSRTLAEMRPHTALRPPRDR
jgi:methylated-DNA-protein-cysteine methyltransferase-like protein